ncbi:hypothetical protein F1D05_10085 [Kribbella qitaiheensis]|uniref:Uncharacterized protein n=1 Tax=Kribbella qitaiheensis TaxID=1544730 RepID=A0A7G6WW14_9ACTN|nr:hypothetical protein [Kribbella qitaiheensis]QNE18179.1 hypothetical protein F1D05_10085 [Kribbella qitaiheensis]
MVPVWLTVVVALIGVFGTLGAGWLTGRRADRQLREERAVRRLEQERAAKWGLYSEVMRAARAFARSIVAGQPHAQVGEALDRLANVASDIALDSPDLAEDLLGPVLAKGQYLTAAIQRAASRDVVAENLAGYQSVLDELNRQLNLRLAG